MTPAIRIEPFEDSQLDELVALWRESFEWGVGVSDPHPIAEQARYFREQVLPRNAVRVAFVADRMAGFAAASRTGLAQLYVRRGLERRRIGTRLLAWAQAQSEGSLWLYTFARNRGAIAFYERHGFRATARGHEPAWKLDDVRYQWLSAEVEATLADPGTLVNFAYGSNLCTARLRARVPSARPLGAARLAGHRLRWHKVSRDGSSKCDIEPTGREEDAVWGVLFAIARREKVALDAVEGLGNGYDERHVVVDFGGEAREVHTYVATRKDASLRPYDWYKAFVLAGAREHGLPAAYVDTIEAVEAKADDDAGRAATNAELLAKEKSPGAVSPAGL